MARLGTLAAFAFQGRGKSNRNWRSFISSRQRIYVIAVWSKFQFGPLRLRPAHNHIFAFEAKHDAYVFQDAAPDCDFHSRFDDCFLIFHARSF